MGRNNDDFMKTLLATFRVEAGDHLKTLSTGLIELEKAPAEQGAELLETIFRAAHSLKGAARAVDLGEVESVCQSLESLFAALKKGQFAASPALFDLLHQTVEALGHWLAGDQSGRASNALSALTRRLDSAALARRSSPPSKPAGPPPPAEPATKDDAGVLPDLAAETIRVATSKLDRVMRQVEELLVPRLAAGQRVRDLHALGVAVADWKKEWVKVQPALRVMESAFATATAADGETTVARRDLARVMEYLNAEDLAMKSLEDRLARLGKAAERDHRGLAGMAEDLLNEVKEIHLLPFASLASGFPALVRGLARAQAKEVELTIRGGEIEIDRRILEQMKDPLVHLLRNCVDHGIEPPEARAERGKPRHGAIEVAFSQRDSGKAEILIADDGAGIDTAMVKAAAVRLGLIGAEDADALEPAEALQLIFRSQLSTSPIITDISGRGLGLAIVRERLERIGGAVTVESEPGVGTRFRLLLPLTLATLRGVLVRAGGQLFLVPASNVERAFRLPVADIKTVENRETIPLAGRAVSLGWLADALELSRGPVPAEASDWAQVIVLAVGGQRVALRVEAVLDEQEVLLKSLGPQLARVRNVAGASVIGTGQVVPVLNPYDLLKSAVGRGAAPSAPAREAPEAGRQRSILVAEDSITSRSLLKNILESVGYRVVTAVDGIDAYTALKTGDFDLVVSDVEMPRMHGFDLVAKIRADKRLADLPIVLVTALESREQRERGIDVGANAYIVKSSFDQSNLLEVVRRLI